MKWAIAGKNYYREKHVYIPLRLRHGPCHVWSCTYKYMYHEIVASTGSTFNTHSHHHH